MSVERTRAMSWSNWIYLAIGLGLGVGSSWLFGKYRSRTGAVEAGLIDKPEEPIIHLNPPVQELGESAASGSDSSSIPQHDNQDVSALVAKLEQTQIAYQLAHEMSQFKAGFLARTAHELRSPLNSLIGLHQLILSDLCDDPAEERTFVAQAHQSALKLIKLMDQILEVSRLEHGTNHLAIQPLHLATVLTEVYNLAHLLAANRNIHFQLSLTQPEIYVLADPRWLRQALLNLLDICFTQMERGSIFISTPSISVNEGGQVWLDVQLSVNNWLEPVNLIQSPHLLKQPASENAALSPGMSLLLTQTILEVMHCRLDILPLSQTGDADSFTRVQLTIPLVIPEPETVLLGQEEN
jgi:hypothetical protein